MKNTYKTDRYCPKCKRSSRVTVDYLCPEHYDCVRMQCLECSGVYHMPKVVQC